MFWTCLMNPRPEDLEPRDCPEEPSLEEITAMVYGELRRLAAGYLKRDIRATLQPTALVHEVYMRMAGQDELRWRNRGHFFGIAAQCMRQILVEHARARHAAKRGGGARRSDPEELLRLAVEPETGILALDDALSALAEIDREKSRLIELYYFAGLDYRELAETLQVSTTTVKRDLRVARAWLRRELNVVP
jgi:RNA polymerase sigma factor (TIGR02999 family)